MHQGQGQGQDDQQVREEEARNEQRRRAEVIRDTRLTADDAVKRLRELKEGCE